MDWLPLWNKTLWCSKAQALPGESFKSWINLLLFANQINANGTLPPLADIGLAIRLDGETLKRFIAQLIDFGLVDEDETDQKNLSIHDWDQWQIKPPTSTARVKRYRAKSKNRKCDQRETSDETHETHETFQQFHENNETLKRIRREEKRREENTPLPPEPGDGARTVLSAAPSDPELDRISALAEELSGDCSWSMWVSSQAKLGHPAHAIEQAIETCVNHGKWDRRFAGGVLRRLCSEGYPMPEVITRSHSSERKSHAKAYTIIPGP